LGTAVAIRVDGEFVYIVNRKLLLKRQYYVSTRNVYNVAVPQK